MAKGKAESPQAPTAEDVVIYPIRIDWDLKSCWFISLGNSDGFTETNDRTAILRACALADARGVRCFRDTGRTLERVQCEVVNEMPLA
jgi:hypothetical protein